jgi:hypothetical protein
MPVWDECRQIPHGASAWPLIFDGLFVILANRIAENLTEAVN